MPWLEKRNSRWYVTWRSPNGKVCRKRGYTDKLATKQLVADIEKSIARGEQGLLDPYASQKVRPLVEHVRDWVADAIDRGRDDAYRAMLSATSTARHRVRMGVAWRHQGRRF